MPTVARLIFVTAFVLTLDQQRATAHSSLESTLSFWVRPTGIDVKIFMSRGSAAALLEKNGEHLTLMRENFPDFEKRLGTNGPTLLALSTGDGIPLDADASSASMTYEDDICYQLHYPLPKVTPCLLEIHGNYFGKLDDGHVGSIYVLSATDDQLGQGDISADSPDFQVQLPMVSPLPIQTSAVVAAPSLPIKPSNNNPWSLWMMRIGCISLITIVALCGIAKQMMQRRTGS